MIISLVFGVWCLVFSVWGLGFGVWCLVFSVWGLVFGVTGCGVRGANLARPSVRPRTRTRPRRLCTSFNFEDEDD